jgi:hypothetical protein
MKHLLCCGAALLALRLHVNADDERLVIDAPNVLTLPANTPLFVRIKSDCLTMLPR